MNDEKLNQIVAKVRGLLAIAKEKNDDEGLTALTLAQRLMYKYHINEGALEKERDTMVFGLLFDKKQTRAVQALASVIANNFACLIVDSSFSLAGYRITKMSLYGKKSDVKIATELINLAIDTANYKAKQYINEWYAEQQCGRKRAYTNRLKNNYIVGYIQGLKQAFAKQSSERGLIVTNKAARAAYFSKHKAAKSKGISCEYNKDNAYKKGTTDGANFSNHKRLS